MKLEPLTLAQALALSRDYQALVGRVLEKESLGKGNIECIAVAPYEESKQWLFAQYYKECRDPQRALQFYQGPHYDVVALSIPILRKRGILYKDLRTYLQENNLPFLPARYERLSSHSHTVNARP